MKKLLLIDNYDSFTYNLYHLILSSANCTVEVTRNDKITLNQTKNFDAIFLSPGPCTPNESGICLDILQNLSGVIPIFGVCLGMQAMCQVFGGVVKRAKIPVHGKVWDIKNLHNSTIFSNLPSIFKATRYHSLIAEEETLPSCLTITSRSAEDNYIMALSHANHNTHGVQFHPESICSEYGKEMISNFLETI